MRLQFRAPARRLAGVALVAAVALLAACSSSPRNALSTQVSAPTGISLTTSTSLYSVQQGATITVGAIVNAPSTDPNNEGVAWALTGAGTLSNQTKTTVDYTAPTGFAGILSPVIVATGVHDATQTGSITLAAAGTPVINPQPLFPGTVLTPFSANILASGGLAPYTWSLSSDPSTLPPGITLAASATQYATLSGTPTTAGSYNFQLKVVDANGASATVDLLLQVNPQATCLLSGQFAVLETGFIGNRMSVAAASYKIDSSGVVAGFQDFGYTTAVAEPVTGTCTTRTTNNGVLTTVGATRSPQYNYALAITLDHGRVQQMNGGDSTIAAGQLVKQDPTAFSFAQLAGDWAFGALGSYAPAASAIGQRVGVAGRLTLDGNGIVSAGALDANTTPTATGAAGAPFTGTYTAPNSFGRGTLQLNAAGQVWNFVYYVINANKVYLIATDPGNGAPQVAGFMTRQLGAFDSTSLGAQGILSLWGASGQDPPHAVVELGRLSAADTTAKTLTVTLDSAVHASATINKIFTLAAYDVTASGRATLTYTDGTTSRSFVLYLDSPDNGYVVELNSPQGSAGLLEAQVAGPFSGTLPGVFVYGTQFAQDPGPVTLLPLVTIASDVISSGSGTATGNVGLDPATSRGIGFFTSAGSAQTVIVSYEVSPGQVRVLRFGLRLTAAALEFLGT